VEIRSDIVIVGAGPAGITASLFLCREKIPHVLIEKEIFPRDKICGDALSGKVLPVLKKLNPDYLSQLATSGMATASYGIIFSSPDGNCVAIPFHAGKSKTDYAPGFICRRIDFDDFLFRKIELQYAQVYQGTTLLEVERRNGEVWLHAIRNDEKIIFRTHMVIACDGDRSLIARQWGKKKMEPEHYCAGVRAYFYGISDLHPENYIELHFLPELLPGYFWIFPLPGGYANVGAGMLTSAASRRRINLRNILEHIIHHHPHLSQRFKGARREGKIQGWGLPLGSKRRVLSGDHFLLCGDAASLIDPFTGEGISHAMFSGMEAARMAAMAWKQKNFSACNLAAYDQAVYRQLWSELKISHTLQKLCRYPYLFNKVIRKARQNAAFRQLLSFMFEDVQLRQRLRQPSFYLQLLFK
jgi:geranylgeranyl reductase family protein